MLSIEKFMENIAYLNAWYIHFNFGDTYFEEDGEKIPTLRTQLWYEAFADFADDDFDLIVSDYMKENIYPPSSPANLLDFANNKLLGMNKGKGNEAWKELKSLISLHGFKGYRNLDSMSTVYPLKKALENHEDKKILKVYLMMSERLNGMNDFNRERVLNEFLNEYNALLLQEIKNNVIQGKLTNGKKLLKEKWKNREERKNENKNRKR